MELDLTKSSELQGSVCTDASGAVISETKIVSSKAVDIKDFVTSLKSIKLEVRPNALDCGAMTSEGGEEQECSDHVKDDQEKDWSYILK